MRLLNIGVIGCGLRVRAILPLLQKNDQGITVVLRAVCDVRDPEMIKQELAKADIDSTNTQFYTDADEMLSKEQLDGVMIGTRCSLHTKYAVKVLAKKLPLFLEKPVATNQEDWELLKKAYEDAGSEVVVSFPLRITAMVQEVKK